MVRLVHLEGHDRPGSPTRAAAVIRVGGGDLAFRPCGHALEAEPALIVGSEELRVAVRFGEIRIEIQLNKNILLGLGLAVGIDESPLDPGRTGDGHLDDLGRLGDGDQAGELAAVAANIDQAVGAMGQLEPALGVGGLGSQPSPSDEQTGHGGLGNRTLPGLGFLDHGHGEVRHARRGFPSQVAHQLGLLEIHREIEGFGELRLECVLARTDPEAVAPLGIGHGLAGQPPVAQREAELLGQQRSLFDQNQTCAPPRACGRRLR